MVIILFILSIIVVLWIFDCFVYEEDEWSIEDQSNLSYCDQCGKEVCFERDSEELPEHDQTTLFRFSVKI